MAGAATKPCRRHATSRSSADFRTRADGNSGILPYLSDDGGQIQATGLDPEGSCIVGDALAPSLCPPEGCGPCATGQFLWQGFLYEADAIRGIGRPDDPTYPESRKADVTADGSTLV